MRTILITADPAAPSRDVLHPAALALHRGELVSFPTETVYGLGANALDEKAVLRVFEAKGRPAHDPLIVHLAAAVDALLVAEEMPPMAARLAEAFWPGPLTLLLRRREDLPHSVTAGSPLVAVRVPAHPVAHLLLSLAGVPVAAPSANRFAHTSPTTAAHVLADLDGRIEWLIDGGPTPIGVESTVLDATVSPAILLRPGGVPRAALEAVAGRIAIPDRNDRTSDSPGRQERHYAPRARLILVSGSSPVEIAGNLEGMVEVSLKNDPNRVGLLAAEQVIELVAMRSELVGCFSLGDFFDETKAAERLFAGLRSLEDQGCELIITHRFPETSLGEAINDRLERAAHPE